MKDVISFNSSVNNYTNDLPALKFDHMYQNQGRTFGPLLGLFLMKLFASAIAAKHGSHLPVHLNFDPTPWIAYNKPLASYTYSYYPHWYPIKNPHHHHNNNHEYHHTYPTLTTTPPFTSNDAFTSEGDYESYYPEENDYHHNNLVTAESRNSVKKYRREDATTPAGTTSEKPEENSTVTPNPSTIEEPIPAESAIKPRRQNFFQKFTAGRKRQSPLTRREKYPQKRRRTTTRAPDYYDSYEDYPDRYSANRRRPAVASYYDDDDDDYYDSFEATTRYYKNKKRRPTRKNNKNQNRKRFPANDDSFETDGDVDNRVGPQTEIVIVRQAQPTTTEPTTLIFNTTTTSPLTSPVTVPITPTPSTPPPVITPIPTGGANATVNYGYGPSNGNEDVSFTYAPPFGRYQYTVPFFDWYTQEGARNAIVKRVRDIVNFDKKFKFK